MIVQYCYNVEYIFGLWDRYVGDFCFERANYYKTIFWRNNYGNETLLYP